MSKEKELQFEGFKFSTSFNFKNKKQRIDYFDNLLINDIQKFRVMQKKYFMEKLHILTSHLTIISWSIVAIFILMFINMMSKGSPIIFMVNMISYIVFFLAYLILKRVTSVKMRKYIFTITMNSDDSFLNILREETIKLKENKK